MTNSLSLLGIDSIDRLLILSTRQLCLIVAQICLHYTNEFDMKPSENSIRQCSQWISGQIVSYSQHKITIFDIRAFFELKQWRSYRIFNTSSSNSANLLSRKDHSYQMLSMKTLVQTAMLLNELKYQSKKMTFDVVEKILLKNFNVDCELRFAHIDGHTDLDFVPGEKFALYFLLLVLFLFKFYL